MTGHITPKAIFDFSDDSKITKGIAINEKKRSCVPASCLNSVEYKKVARFAIKTSSNLDVFVFLSQFSAMQDMNNNSINTKL